MRGLRRTGGFEQRQNRLGGLTRSRSSPLMVTSAPRNGASDMGTGTSVPDLVKAAYGISVECSVPRFAEPGWAVQGTCAIGCGTCGTDSPFIVYRKPYTTPRGTYRYWAIVCLPCKSVRELKAFEAVHKEAFRSWDAQVSSNPSSPDVTDGLPGRLVGRGRGPQSRNREAASELEAEPEPDFEGAAVGARNANQPPGMSAHGDEIKSGQLSRRALSAVRKHGWARWSQLAQVEQSEIRSLRGVDERTKQEIAMAIESRLELGSAVEAMRRDLRVAQHRGWAPPGLRFEDELLEFGPIDTATLLALREMGITTWGLLVTTELDIIARHPDLGPRNLLRIRRAIRFRAIRIAECAPVYEAPDFSADELHDTLRTALHSLGPRRRAVVIGRVIQQPPVSPRELRRSLGLRKEQVHQLEAESIQRLSKSLAQNPDTPMSRAVRQSAHFRAGGFAIPDAVERSLPGGTDPGALRLLIRLAEHADPFMGV